MELPDQMPQGCNFYGLLLMRQALPDNFPEAVQRLAVERPGG